MSWRDRTRSIENWVRMAWKRLLSYRKQHWELNDYPIVVREQTDVPPTDRYWARIPGWNIDGTGATHDDALRNLEHWYEVRESALQEAGKPLPRPGTEVPIQFASQERVNADVELLDDFIERVLEVPWAFLSDESSLWDFHTDANHDTWMAKISEIYGVDVSDIESGNIAEMLERISAARTR